MKTKEKYVKELERIKAEWGESAFSKYPEIFYPLILDVLCEINDNLTLLPPTNYQKKEK